MPSHVIFESTCCYLATNRFFGSGISCRSTVFLPLKLHPASAGFFFCHHPAWVLDGADTKMPRWKIVIRRIRAWGPALKAYQKAAIAGRGLARYSFCARTAPSADKRSSRMSNFRTGVVPQKRCPLAVGMPRAVKAAEWFRSRSNALRRPEHCRPR